MSLYISRVLKQLQSIFINTLLTFLFTSFITSCNQQKVKDLEKENKQLNLKVEELETELEERTASLEDLTRELSKLEYSRHSNDFLLKHCEEQFQAYKYGKNKSLTRYDKALGRQVTVYGAENIIDFLNRHYSPN